MRTSHYSFSTAPSSACVEEKQKTKGFANYCCFPLTLFYRSNQIKPQLTIQPSPKRLVSEKKHSLHVSFNISEDHKVLTTTHLPQEQKEKEQPIPTETISLATEELKSTSDNHNNTLFITIEKNKNATPAEIFALKESTKSKLEKFLDDEKAIENTYLMHNLSDIVFAKLEKKFDNKIIKIVLHHILYDYAQIKVIKPTLFPMSTQDRLSQYLAGRLLTLCSPSDSELWVDAHLYAAFFGIFVNRNEPSSPLITLNTHLPDVTNSKASQLFNDIAENLLNFPNTPIQSLLISYCKQKALEFSGFYKMPYPRSLMKKTKEKNQHIPYRDQPVSNTLDKPGVSAGLKPG